MDDKSPVVIIALTEVFDETVPSEILFPFSWNPYLKTDGTSLPSLFLVENFKEKEIEFLKEWFCQKLLLHDDNNWANEREFLKQNKLQVAQNILE